jgi:hypothetical protein
MTKAKAKQAAIENTNTINNAADEFNSQINRNLVVANDDKNTDELVRAVERRAIEGQRNPVDLINAETRGVLVLFPYKPLNPVEGTKYPVLKGHLDTKNVRCPVSVFTHVTEEGREYASLSIGVKAQEHIGGALFRHEVQNEINGAWELTPGKENLRFGQIAKSICIDEDKKEYEIIFQLQVSGLRKMSNGGVPFIKANVYPVRNKADESLEAMQACF